MFSLFLLASTQAQTASPFLIPDKTIPLPGVEGRIDHMAADVSGQRLFMAALGNNTVEVLDLKSGKVIQSLSGFAEPQGIVYVPEFDRIFIANGADGTCRILNGHSFKTLNSIETGDDADNVRYDDAAKKVYVGYGSGALAVIDAKTDAKVADIPLAAHPESFRMETNTANLYVNIPEAGQIAVVDRNKGMVTASWPMKAAQGNFPMFLDEAGHRMFVGCRTPAMLLVYDFAMGRLVTSIPISRDTDDLFYDSRNRLIYVSCGGGRIEVIKQIDADHYQKADSIATMPGARTSLFIPELNLFCVAVPHRGSQAAEILVYKTQ
jgi:hypothetical protein